MNIERELAAFCLTHRLNADDVKLLCFKCVSPASDANLFNRKTSKKKSRLNLDFFSNFIVCLNCVVRFQ